MKYVKFLPLVAALLVMACGGGGQQNLQKVDTGDIPAWYLNPPTDPAFVYATSTSTSQDMQMAINKAEQDCRAEIARQVESKVSALTKKFDEEVGGKDAQLLTSFTSASKTVASTSLSGAKTKQRDVKKDGSMFRAYVLMEYNVAQSMVSQMKKEEQLYTRFRATQTYKELEDEAQKVDDAKKTQ
ncbi:MAG TPA: hypothetical protein VMM37_01570 [Bacteroidota bacterium]|nr:hypothetical protein [Bacteroidota bacterium]